jgi:hypothetical protein
MIVTIGESLSSSDARAAIMSRHEALRGLVTETMLMTEGAAGRPDDEPLRAHARGLYAAFADHLDFEERILAIALGDVIGWGGVLVRQIEQDHQRARAALASAASALDPGGGGDGLVEHLRGLATSLLRSLDSEERCLFTADLDALAVDSRGG